MGTFIRPVIAGFLPALATGVVIELVSGAFGPGSGRGALVAPIAFVAVGLGVALVPALRRAAWFLSAAAVLAIVGLAQYRGPLYPYRHPGLVLIALLMLVGL